MLVCDEYYPTKENLFYVEFRAKTGRTKSRCELHKRSKPTIVLTSELPKMKKQ